MDVWVVLVIVLAVLALLAVGGALAQRRRLAATKPRFEGHLEQANRDLAAARAADRGWERATLEAAARDAFARERPGAVARSMTLVQVIDRPGTDEDEAIFRFEAGGEEVDLVLGRRGGAWAFERMRPPDIAR